MPESFLLRVVNRLGEPNTILELTPPLRITKLADQSQTVIRDADGQEYRFLPDGSFSGLLITVNPQTTVKH